jgi:hypothetical protein
MATPTQNVAQIPALDQETIDALTKAAQGLPPATLTQAQGFAEAFNPLLQAQQARRTNELAPLEQQATQAQQAYNQMAAAPPPQVSGARAGLNELLGSVASILSGNQAYRETASQRLQKEQQALMESRVQNLTSLKNLYDQRAEAAKSLGNSIAEEENRIKRDRLDKSLETINKARAQQYEMDQIDKRARAEAAKTAATKEVVTPQEMGQAVRTAVLADGTPITYVDMRMAKDKEERATLRAIAQKNGAQIWDQQTAETVAKTQKSTADIDGILENIGIFPRPGTAERIQDIAKNAWYVKTQTGNGVWLKKYEAQVRSAAISAVQTVASLGKGFRLNKAEIDAMQDYDFPKVTDSQDVARGKLEVLREMISHVENIAVYGNPYRVPAGASEALVARYRELKAESARQARDLRSGSNLGIIPAKEKDLGKPAAGGQIRVFNTETREYGLANPKDPGDKRKIDSGVYRIKGR